MVRNTAREIAIHLSYELSFTDLPVDQLLDCRLTADALPHWRERTPSTLRSLTPSRRIISAVW